MSLLLDTHVLLWWLEDDPELSSNAREAIMNELDVFVSAASIWEIAIKEASGKLRAPSHFLDNLERERFRPLPISLDHAYAAGALPRHHNDPFDRMLVAQAAIEGLSIVTRDKRFAVYDVPTIFT
ncbi:MAG TPA: type II toxin-antitoxin system VapC family toxin [Dehalococcoidia bacterium]|nr:type II toxin-antitoxin system VapC family toxin [Dehalococcoidia bacterium]